MKKIDEAAKEKEDEDSEMNKVSADLEAAKAQIAATLGTTTEEVEKKGCAQREGGAWDGIVAEELKKEGLDQESTAEKRDAPTFTSKVKCFPLLMILCG